MFDASGIRQQIRRLRKADRATPVQVMPVDSLDSRWNQQILDGFAKTLFQDGYLVIPDYVAASTCIALSDDVEDKLKTEGILERANAVREGNIESVPEQETVDGALVIYRASEVRGKGYDTGMLIVQDIERMVPSVTKIGDDPTIRAICTAANGGKSVRWKGSVLYYNDSVVNPRRLHMDSIGTQFKVFLYLTDVASEADGPYSYVAGSHGRVWSRYCNTIITQSLRGKWGDAWIYNPLRHRRLTAPRGTLIISNQRGYHGGTPQLPGHRRIMVVQNYVL